MKPPLHRWDLTTSEAVELQTSLRRRLILAPGQQPLPRLIAGVDCSSEWHGNHLWAAIVVWDRETGELIEVSGASAATAFPYVPGFLTFREGPIILEALRSLRSQPEAFLFDGQGICHPRRFGIAAHLGLWVDRPSVGVAKSRLIGEASEPAPEPGSREPIMDAGECLGALLRTRPRANPLWISPGHRTDIDGAVALVLACCRGYRLPEPTRLAHIEVGKLRRSPGRNE